MVDNGELEFFEFSPTDFLNDLQTSIEETILNFVEKEFSFAKSAKRKKIKDLMLESTKKNLFLFRNFVLKNILGFPPKFNLERKLVDYLETHEINLNEFATGVNNLINVRNEIRKEIRKEKEAKVVAEYERSQLKALGLGEDDLKEMALSLLNLKDKHRRIQEYVKKIPFCTLNEEDFNSLLEHRELRSEMLKKELRKMQESVDIDYLNSLIQNK